MPVGEAEPLTNHFGDCIGAEVRQPFFAAELCDEAGILAILPFASDHFCVEVRLHFKELGKVLFVGLEQVIDHGRPDHDDFHRDGDGLRPEAGSRESIELAGVFDFHFSRFDDSL